ncbi:hypothetical protein Dda3937_02092 [Dickeya dadantii 3937]|uniref:Uncharacterized protein n=1 Tax=Dickeya dadantii (strain 3937) TaxID=198628 RepID=E0SDG2_DICD3|nr:hypothetical protein Dda3937_02092 [Dickeya dadantii 3937]
MDYVFHYVEGVSVRYCVRSVFIGFPPDATAQNARTAGRITRRHADRAHQAQQLINNLSTRRDWRSESPQGKAGMEPPAWLGVFYRQ